jgi:hypothetical protein
MPTTRSQARDDMVGVAVAALASVSISGDRVRSDAKGSPSRPSGSSAWAMVRIRHDDSEVASLAGRDGTRRFIQRGSLIVDVYENGRDGLAASDASTSAVKAALDGIRTENGVVLGAASAVEVGEDSPWFLTSVSARFRYDEFH